jgi:hypothetical protein
MIATISKVLARADHDTLYISAVHKCEPHLLVCCSGVLGGVLNSKLHGQRCAVLEGRKTPPSALDKFRNNLVWNSFLEDSNGDCVIRIAPEHLSDDLARSPEQLQAKTIAHDVRCELHAPGWLHCVIRARLTPPFTRGSSPQGEDRRVERIVMHLHGSRTR